MGMFSRGLPIGYPKLGLALWHDLDHWRPSLDSMYVVSQVANFSEFKHFCLLYMSFPFKGVNQDHLRSVIHFTLNRTELYKAMDHEISHCIIQYHAVCQFDRVFWRSVPWSYERHFQRGPGWNLTSWHHWCGRRSPTVGVGVGWQESAGASLPIWVGSSLSRLQEHPQPHKLPRLGWIKNAPKLLPPREATNYCLLENSQLQEHQQPAPL